MTILIRCWITINPDYPVLNIFQQRHYFANKGLSSQGYSFSSGHVWMWDLDCEESWAPKNWCFWTVVSENTLESPLDCRATQPVHSEGDQSWVFFGRTDAKAETLVLWPPHVKSWLTGKDSDAGRDWGQEEKGTTEDEMAGWYHRLDGREFEWTPGVGDGKGGLACCNSWCRKESDMPERLNWKHKGGDLKVRLICVLIRTSKKQESSRKTSVSALLTMPKPLTVWITINCGKFWKIWEYQTTWPASWETCMKVRK